MVRNYIEGKLGQGQIEYATKSKKYLPTWLNRNSFGDVSKYIVESNSQSLSDVLTCKIPISKMARILKVPTHFIEVFALQFPPAAKMVLAIYKVVAAGADRA